MELSRPPLVVAFELSEKRKAIVADALVGASAVVYLTELDEAARAEALRNTGALLTFNTSKELRSGEAALLDGARLIQFNLRFIMDELSHRTKNLLSVVQAMAS